MVLNAGYSVLRLPLYHYVINPIGMVWSQLKQHARRLIIYSSQPSKVVNLICEACDWKIIENKWKNDAAHIIKRNSSLGFSFIGWCWYRQKWGRPV